MISNIMNATNVPNWYITLRSYESYEIKIINRKMFKFLDKNKDIF